MNKGERIIIGITDCGLKFPNYENWVKSHGSDVEVVKLSYRLDNLNYAHRCDAFLLSGGEDVHPKFYRHPEYFEMLDATDIDEERDKFELGVIEAAEKNNKPLLGICRGLQVSNVYFGGTLIPDILTRLNVDGHNKDEDDDDSLHHVRVEAGTLLHKLVHETSGEVNSAHHQSADKMGEGLRPNAYSHEGIVEGLEKFSEADEPGILLVQWHPERMRNQQSRFAGNLREWLINEAWKWK